MKDIITLDQYGETIKILVRRSSKAKNIAVRITYRSAELVLPHGVDSSIGYKFLLKKEYWIRRKLRNTIISQQPEDATIPILGKAYKVVYITSNNHSVKLNHDTIEVHTKDNMRKTILEVFLKNKLLAKITELTTTIAGSYKLSYSKIMLIDNISKWGSCSSKKILSFHWRIIFAPEDVLKYLVVHEMCHLKEMNHSKNFWFLVATIYPDYSAARLWLKREGGTLHHYLT